MKEELNTENKSTPKILAVGGGKGGAGKSVFSTILAFWLARIGHRTVLMDVDLGGANLHTLLGIKSPDRTLNDFITRKFGELEDICIDTSVSKCNPPIVDIGVFQFQFTTAFRENKIV